jgi:hypothetical protein
MTRSALIPSCSLALLALLVACDKAPEPVAEAQPAPPAAPPTEAAYTAEARVDLEGIATLVESGEVQSATELESELNAREGGLASVDIDADGTVDELRIVETRAEKSTVFEVHAVPSSAKEVTAEAAPMVAKVELTADATSSRVDARFSLDASFKSVAKIEGSGEVTRTLGGIGVDVDGRLEITHEAKPFVAWVFEPERPRYVATVFVAKAEKPEPDPCWPPGHCKHDLWKATGEEPPGHERHDEDDEGHGKKDDKGHAKADKAEDKADKKADKADKKADAPDAPGKSDKSDKKDDKPDKKDAPGKADKKGDAPAPKGDPKSDAGKAKGADKSKDKGKAK